MNCGPRARLEEADAEVEAARRTLAAALATPLNDETANERISAAAHRLRVAQARRTAATTEPAYRPDWIRSG